MGFQSPGGTPNGTENPEKESLLAAADWLKYTILFATGALIFSAGLLSENINLTGPAKSFLIGSWILLAIAILAGVMAFGRIPVLLRRSNYDLEDRRLTYPSRIFLLCFTLGILSLGVTLILSLLAGSKTIQPVPSAKPTSQGEVTAPQAHNSVTSSVTLETTTLEPDSVSERTCRCLTDTDSTHK